MSSRSANATNHLIRQSYLRQLEAERWLQPAPDGIGTQEYVQLQRGFARLRRDLVAGRLALFRDHIGRTVETVSPLLVRLCELEARGVDDLALRLRPDAEWQGWLCGRKPASPSMSLSKMFDEQFGPGEEAARHWLERFAHGGLVVRDRDEADARGGLPFGIRVLDGGLELGAFFGDARLRTHGAMGSITLPTELPETLIAALPGQPLDRLVAHPLLDGAGCVIEHVDDPTRWGIRVVFALAPMPWKMPWHARRRGTQLRPHRSTPGSAD